MGNRTWVKTYCAKWLRGSLRQETAALRGTWADVLNLAGDGSFGDQGIIQLSPGVGLTDNQLSRVLNISLDEWITAKERLLATDRIGVNGDNIIHVINWKTYQSEYNRQRNYRKEYERVLQRKVTTEGYNGVEGEEEERTWEGGGRGEGGVGGGGEKEREKEKEKEKEKESTPPILSKDNIVPPGGGDGGKKGSKDGETGGVREELTCWPLVLAGVNGKVTKPNRMWLEDIEPQGILDGVVILAVERQDQLRHLQKSFHGLLLRVLREELKKEVGLKFILREA